MMRPVVGFIVGVSALTLAWGGVASARGGQPLPACPLVSLADASRLLGDRTFRVPTNDPDCLYAAAPAMPGGTTRTLLVQVSRWARQPTVPQFASPAEVARVRRCWSVQLQGIDVSCYRNRRFVGVTATGTPDDLATAKAGMEVALANLSRKR